MPDKPIKDLSPHWFWLPFLLVLVQFGIHAFAPGFYSTWVDGERGAVELLTPLGLIPAMIAGVYLLRQLHRLPGVKLRVWTAMVALGTLYFAGEELSWGQWIWNWNTPDFWSTVNDQNETNLHNTSSWLDQKPRLILELWALIGGLVYFFRRSQHSPAALAGLQYAYWPTAAAALTGLLSAIVMLVERVNDWFDWVVPKAINLRVTETQELVLGFYLSFYLISLAIRLKSRPA